MNWSTFDLVGYAKALYDNQVQASQAVAEAFGVRATATTWEDLSSDQRGKIIAYAYTSIDCPQKDREYVTSAGDDPCCG